MTLIPSSRGQHFAWRSRTKVCKVVSTDREPDSILSSVCARVCVRAGYGLHCHRAVITMCKLIGIKDLYCRVEGSVNLLNITRAFFTGLANQVRSCDQTQPKLLDPGSRSRWRFHLAGNPPEAGWQESAPRGGVSGAPRPAAPGGGQSQRRSAAWRWARGRGPQHATALGRRSSVTGTQTLHLGGRQTHHLVGSDDANEAKDALKLDGEHECSSGTLMRIQETKGKQR